jgi:Flp pilus assembly protein TadD
MPVAFRRSNLALRVLPVLALYAITLLALVLAGCHSGNGQFTTAEKSEAQQKMAMLKSGTQWQMAQQQFLAGDLDKSLKTVDNSLALNPQVAKSHVLRGRIMLEKSRLEEARNEFLIAEKLDPQFVEAQYYLGIVHERVNEPEEAIVRYKKAMELDPANAQYVVAAAEMYISQNKLDDAEQLLIDQRKHLQYNPAIRQTQGHIAMLRGDPKRAAILLHEALLLAPGDEPISEDLAEAQIDCGQFADAEVLLSRLLDKDENKNRRDLKSMQAHCLIQLNRTLEARAVLQELTGDKEGAADVRAWTDLGNVAATLHDKANLRAAMQRVTAIAPDKPDGYMLRAMYCRQDNRLEDALTASDQAISKAPKCASPYVLKAMILQDMDRVSQARATLIQAQQFDPKNQQVQAYLAAIDSGNAKGAIAGERTE